MGYAISMQNKDDLIIPTPDTLYQGLTKSEIQLYFLLQYANKYVGPMDINMTNEQLGKYLGVSSKTISLAVKKLREQGLISVQYTGKGNENRSIALL
jgi:CRP-like cAMP-binding protein